MMISGLRRLRWRPGIESGRWVFRDRRFFKFDDRNSGRTFSGTDFYDCSFDNCNLSLAKWPARRSVVRDVRLFDCKYFNSYIRSAVFDNVLVDGLETNQLMLMWDPVFRHVVVRGRIGEVKVNASSGKMLTPAQEQAFREANAEFYKTVDWALDIREAECKYLGLFGVPARLVVRDPETQVIVTRERALALEGRWRELDLRDSGFGVAIQWMLDYDLPDVVLVAGKRARDFAGEMQDLRKLRKAGVVEPD